MVAYNDEVLLDSPLAFWSLDETSGVTLADAIGGLDLSMNGTPDLNQTGPFDGAKSVQLNPASHEFLTRGSTTTFDLPSITAEIWVYMDTSSGAGVVLLGSRSTSVGTTVRFSCSLPVDYSRMEAWNGAAVVTSSVFPEPLMGRWAHLVWVWTNSMVIFYCDGVRLSASSLAMGAATNQPLRVGGAEIGSSHFEMQGRIAKPALYGAALPPYRIANHSRGGEDIWVDEGSNSPMMMG